MGLHYSISLQRLLLQQQQQKVQSQRPMPMGRQTEQVCVWVLLNCTRCPSGLSSLVAFSNRAPCVLRHVQLVPLHHRCSHRDTWTPRC